jgi:hypothetical protein
MLQSKNGRIISTNSANNPSVGCWDTSTSSNVGMWNNANVLIWGGMDGNGVATVAWGHLASTEFQVEASVFRLSSFNNHEWYWNCDTGGNKIQNYRNGWYDYWNATSGARQWVGPAGGLMLLDGSGNVTILGTGSKPGGGAWADSSDARIKTVLGDYTSGLDAILALHPVRYSFKGNWRHAPPPPIEGATGDGSDELDQHGPHDADADAGTEFIGLIAQEAEGPMPEMVSQQSAIIDGERVEDMRFLNTTALSFALVNAVKELTARVAALETAITR